MHYNKYRQVKYTKRKSDLKRIPPLILNHLDFARWEIEILIYSI